MYYQNGKQVIVESGKEGVPDAHVCDSADIQVAAAIVAALNLREDTAKGGTPDAPAATHDQTLLEVCAGAIARRYIGVSASKVKALQAAEDVLEKVMEFYSKMEGGDVSGS